MAEALARYARDRGFVPRYFDQPLDFVLLSPYGFDRVGGYYPRAMNCNTPAPTGGDHDLRMYSDLS